MLLSPEFLATLVPRPREKQITGGWQAGKSEEGFCELAIPVMEDYVLESAGLKDSSPRLYWNILPAYTAPHKEWDYLRAWAARMKIITRLHEPDNDSFHMELFGGRFVYETKTAKDVAGIAGEPCDGVLMSEPGQMEEAVLEQARGRLMTRRGWLSMNGTIEPPEAAPRWAWYEKLAHSWKDDGDPDHLTICLPSWANLSVFPGGRQDPEILRQERLCGGADSIQFRRRFAGEPVGVSYPIYWQLENDPDPDKVDIHPRGFYDSNPVWMGGRGAGGHDFGSGGAYNHPSTLVAGTVLNRGIENQNIVVVREAWDSLTQDQNEIEYHRRRLSQKYSIPRDRWGFDPMQSEAAKMAGGKTTGGPGSRPEKVGMVEARLNRGTLLFDFSGPGVKGLYAQLRRVHWVKRTIVGRGDVYEYDRDDDDLAAGFEDMIYIIDGEQRFQFRPGKLPGLSVKKAPAKVLKRLF